MATVEEIGGEPPAKGSLWRDPAFGRLWLAQTVSQFGSQITVVALPLVAIIVLDATPMQAGLLGFFQFLPFLLFGLPAGAIVDRNRRRPILILCDAGRAAVLGLVPLAYLAGWLNLPVLYLAAFLTGVLTVFFDIAYQAYLPSLVPTDRLVEGNSKLETSRSLAQLAGPGLGGVLIRWLGAPVGVLVDAITYLVSWVFLLGIRDTEARPAGGDRKAMAKEIGFGLRYVRDHKLLRPIAISTAIANLALGGFMQSVFMLYAVRTLQMSAATIGLMVALGNGGALLAALVAFRLRDRVSLGPTIIGAATVTGLGTLALGAATRGTAFAVLSGGMFVIGFASLVYNINQVSLRQAITPAHLQGRMNATMRFLAWGTIPLGALLIGFVAEIAGIRESVWVVAAIACVSVVPLLLSPLRSLKRIPDSTPVHT